MPMLATWCRLVVVATVMRTGVYTRVLSIDTDTVIHQPYASLDVLERFGRHRTIDGKIKPYMSVIATSDQWWSGDKPCAGNMLFLNRSSTHALLRAW